MGHIDAPLKVSALSGEKNKKSIVTIVVTLDGIGSAEPLRRPLDRPPDAGTVEEYVASPVVGSVSGGSAFAAVTHLLPS